jgi:hypothetical protein
VLVYVVAWRFYSRTAGVLAALIWFWWEPVYGNVLFYFDSILGLVFLLSVLVWIWLEKRDPAWNAPFVVGVFLGGGTLIKQHAWAVVIMFGIWLVFVRRGYIRDLVAYGIGVLLLPGAAVAIMIGQGTFGSYLFWNWGLNFSSVRPGSMLTGNYIRKLLFTVAFVPIFVLMMRRLSNFVVAALLLMLWLAANATLLPNFGEIYVMAQLPLVAIMSGIAVALILPELVQRQASTSQRAMLGFAAIIGIGWLWTGVVAYFPSLGRAAIPAYDEFVPVAERLNAMSVSGDTLFVLPEYDGTAQLHVLTDMLPPGTWLNGHRWFLAVPGVVDGLLEEWRATPPTFIVSFPTLSQEAQPYIDPLVAFMNVYYSPIETIPDIPFNGDAIIYRLHQER